VGIFFAGETESGDSNFDRFSVLVEELKRFKSLIDEQCSTREERVKMFEEGEMVGAMLGQMRGIVKETSYWAFRHRTCGGRWKWPFQAPHTQHPNGVGFIRLWWEWKWEWIRDVLIQE
jgi:hypothetical protein